MSTVENARDALLNEVEQMRSELAEREAQVAEQTLRLAEAQELLRAIREADLDGLVLSTPSGQRVFTLQGTDRAYQTMVEQMQEGAVTVVPDGWVSYSNRRFAEMLKRPLEQVIGSQIRDHVAEADRDAVEQFLADAWQMTARGEITLRAADGALVPVHLSLGRVAHDGQPSLSVVVTDLSERRRAEELLASERFVRSILNQAADGILVCDREGHVLFANDSVRSLAGVDIVGLPLCDAIAAWGEVFFDDGKPVPVEESSLVTTLQGNVTIGQEVRLMAVGGRQYDILANASPLRSPDGSIVGAVATFTDISRRKRAEESEREQKNWLDVMLNSIGDAVIATDMTGSVTFLNPVAAKLTGWTAAEAVGQPVATVFPIISEKTRQPAGNVLQRVLGDKQIVAVTNDTVLVAKDGREVPIEENAAPICNPDGSLLGAVLVFHDVTGKRRAEAETRQYIEHLRSTNEELAMFNAAMVDRELRMVELKKEVNELCQRVGESRRYPHALTREQEP